jgi:hypothetical protein
MPPYFLLANKIDETKILRCILVSSTVIYRDDGLVIMNGLKTNEEISQWLGTFQERVNQVTGYEGLVFTVSIWKQGGDVKPTHPKAEIRKSSVFPFLDMKISWS